MTLTARLGLLLMAGALCWGQTFRAAVAKVDITPDGPQYLLGYGERKSTSVLDRIFHRVVVMDDGKTQFILVSSDLCVVSPSEYDKVAGQLKARFGTEPVNFWWSLTHTHSAPEVGPPGLPAVFMGERYKHEVDEAYTALVERKLVDAVGEARQKLEPARLGVGWGYAAANINRRARDVDGQTSLGLNPDGPVDRRLNLLRLDTVGGKLLATIANYAIHGTVMSGANLAISGDAPGVVSEYVEQKTGAPLVFVNGAAGDIAPIYSVYPDPRSGHLSQFRVLLGDRVLETLRRVRVSKGAVVLRTAELIIETPRKEGLGWTPDLASYLRESKTGGALVRLPIRLLQINDDVAVWSAPLEMFCQIAMAVRDRSPFAHTMYFGYTNGWLGYMPTAEEWPHGGYEPRVSPYTPQAGQDVVEAVSRRLREMARAVGELENRDE